MHNKKSADNLLNNDIVVLYSTEDEKIELLGKLLITHTARIILTNLFSDTITAEKLSEKTDISLQLVIFHLKRLQELGIVKVIKIEKNSKGHDMKYYTASKFAIVVLPPKVIEKAKNSKLLRRSFNLIYRLTAVSITAISSWFITQYLQKKDQIQDIPDGNGLYDYSPSSNWFNVQSEILSLIIAVLVVTIGLIIINLSKIRNLLKLTL
jgi:DNA-binding transcriptional ArsR family regulator